MRGGGLFVFGNGTSQEVSRMREDQDVDLGRSSGILLHPTSLPGGRLGDEAYRFVDWLAEAGQSWWQMLPLGPPDEFGSPYRTTSAFAGSPALLGDPQAPVSADEIETFVAQRPYWTGEWARWGTLADQVRFQREWSALRDYARDRGVRLIGDVPIYVSDEGADIVTWPELFAHGEVAGAPPDPLNANGQHWGNPLYDWPEHRRTAFRWWIERFARTFELVDVARVDHFRGFVSYWAIPAGHKTARRGRWRPAPGRELFTTIKRALGHLSLIAEDLGVITPAVYRLRDALGLPGMVVLHWAFGGPPANIHAPSNHPKRAAVYTSTHDTDTTVGWYASLGKRERAAAALDPAEPNWSLIEIAMQSRAELAVVPLQDVLGLGSEARMNHPGQPYGNWRWQFAPGALTDELAARLREATTRGARAAVGADR